jgi:hypothetical protein
VSGTLVRCSVDSEGKEGSLGSSAPFLSGDGRCVAFRSPAGNFSGESLALGGTVFVHELESGRTERVSLAIDGRAMSAGVMGPSVSADGNLVAIYAEETLAAKPDARLSDVLLFDRRNGACTRVNAAASGIEATIGPYPVSLAGDGSTLVFQATADFDLGLRAGCCVLDVASGKVERLPCGAAEMWSMWPSISADGNVIAIAHMAMKGADPRAAGSYLLDRRADTLEAVLPGADGAPGPASMCQVSPDGHFVVFAAVQHGKGASTEGVARAFEHLDVRSADSRDGEELLLLGMVVELGEGGRPRDPARARELYRRACDLGVAPACAALQRPPP